MYNYEEEKEAAKKEDAEEDEPTNKALPQLSPNEPVKALKITPEQHFTKPPYPYSEALLVKALEQHGVGRPSTYAQIIATLKKRGYVQVEKRKLASTALGKEVHQVLNGKLPKLFDVDFTAQMESSLDNIAEGKLESVAYLKSFWAQVSPMFGDDVIQGTISAKASSSKARSPRKPRAEVPISELGACPKCGKALVKRTSKRGEFLGCSGFPRCRFIKDSA
jgi:DNA topoisomerase-1